MRNKKSDERESDIICKDSNRHFLVWTAKNPIEKKFYFSDEEFAAVSTLFHCENTQEHV